MAPADVPEIASMRSHGSSSRRSSTPHVNAPCEPPPCSARSIRSGSRVTAASEGAVCITPQLDAYRPSKTIATNLRVDDGHLLEVMVPAGANQPTTVGRAVASTHRLTGRLSSADQIFCGTCGSEAANLGARIVITRGRLRHAEQRDPRPDREVRPAFPCHQRQGLPPEELRPRRHPRPEAGQERGGRTPPTRH